MQTIAISAHADDASHVHATAVASGTGLIYTWFAGGNQVGSVANVSVDVGAYADGEYTLRVEITRPDDTVVGAAEVVFHTHQGNAQIV